MPINYAIYNALRTRPSYEQKARAAQQEMGYLSELNKMTSMQNKERLQAEDAVQQRLSQFSETEGLERDKGELLALMKKEEGKIIRGIRDAGGDSKRYINSGGLSDLRKYYTNIKSSEQLQNTINNKKHHDSYQDSLNKGMLAIPTVMAFDQNGNVADPKDPNAKKRSVSFGEQLSLYEEGKIESLDWQGAQKPIAIKPGMFLNIPNPRNPLKQGPVKVDELQNYLIGMGQNPLIANMLAEKGRVGDTDNTQYMYGVDQLQVKLHASNKQAGEKQLKELAKQIQTRRMYDEKVAMGGYADANKGRTYFYKPGAAATGHQKAEIIDQSGLAQGEEYKAITEKPFNLKWQAPDIYKSLLEYVGYNADDPKKKILAMSNENKDNQQYFMRTNSGEMAKMDFNAARDLDHFSILGEPEFIQLQEANHIAGSGEMGQKGNKRGYFKIRIETADDMLQKLGLATNWLVGEDIIDKAQANIFTEGDENFNTQGSKEYQTDLYIAIPDMDNVAGKLAGKVNLPEYMGGITDPRMAYMFNMQNNPAMAMQNQYMLQYLMDQGANFSPNQSNMTKP